MFTPSEAGAFACVYAVVIGVVVYKQFSWKGMVQTLESTVVDIGMVMLLIALSATFSYGIIWDQIPQKMAEFMLGISNAPWVVMLIIIGFLLFAGTAMDSTVLILMLTSILTPVAEQVNVDLVHFGIIMVLTLTVGLLTPPRERSFILSAQSSIAHSGILSRKVGCLCCLLSWWSYGYFLAGFGFMASESDIWN